MFYRDPVPDCPSGKGHKGDWHPDEISVSCNVTDTSTIDPDKFRFISDIEEQMEQSSGKTLAENHLSLSILEWRELESGALGMLVESGLFGWTETMHIDWSVRDIRK